MGKFAIVSDSCCDLNSSLREKFGIDYVPMYFSVDGKEYFADLDWKEISAADFYAMMRAGKIMKTAQVTEASYREKFEYYLNNGYDVLYVACSSALSYSVNTSYKVRDELKEQYPDSKIICVDSLNSCYGLGLLCITASVMRNEGKSIEEVAKWLDDNKLKVNQEATADKLTYLKQAGRVSATSAFFGGLLNIKPIIISDAKGNNAAVEKVKGRSNAINRIAERVKEEYENHPYQRLFFAHADCESDVEELKKAVGEKIGFDGIETYTDYIGPIIGASVGPGTVVVYFIGKEVTFNK